MGIAAASAAAASRSGTARASQSGAGSPPGDACKPGGLHVPRSEREEEEAITTRCCG